MFTPTMEMVLLYVKDPLVSAEFYGKLFGLKPREQAPTFVLFEFNNVQLGLWAAFEVEPQATGTPGASEIAFREDNIDELYKRLQELHVPIAQEPTNMDFGRTMVVLDPDGHRVRFYKLQRGA